MQKPNQEYQVSSNPESKLVLGMDLSSLYGARVLVAEDNDINQVILMELVTALGLLVEIAENGQVALELLEQKSFDLILMDMYMPVLDGMEATRAIRQNSDWQNLPIVAMTGNTSEEDRLSCREAGMNDCILKPIDPEELCRIFLRWISRTEKDLIVVEKRKDTQLATEGRFLSPIHGLDVSVGLNRVVGNQPVYISILRKFISGRKNTVPQIRLFLKTENIKEALRVLHTMKGVAGNIGAMQIFNLSYDLESSLKKGQSREEVETCLIALETALQKLIDDLEKALPPELVFTPVSVDEIKLSTICADVIRMLLDDDTAATFLLEENGDLLASAFSEDFAKIKEAIKSYEFETAIAAIENARKSRDLNINERDNNLNE